MLCRAVLWCAVLYRGQHSNVRYAVCDQKVSLAYLCETGAAYAAKKAELAEERKRREAEREAAKEARRQAMRDYMEHNFLQVLFLAIIALLAFCSRIMTLHALAQPLSSNPRICDFVAATLAILCKS